MDRRQASATVLGAAAFLLVAVPGRTDARGEELLRGAMKKLHAAESYSATLSITNAGPGQPEVKSQGSLAAMKPNFLRVEIKGPADAGGSILFAADGKHYNIYIAQANQYLREDLDPAPTELRGQWEAEVDAFFGGERGLPKSGATHVGTAKVGGVECDLVKIEPAKGRSTTYAIGKRDGLIHQTRIVISTPEGNAVTTNTLTNIKLNQPKKPAEFAFNPPEGARLFERPNFDGNLVPVGKPAPDFQLPQPGGQLLSLEKTLKEKKAVLINFWFYG